MKWWVSWCIVHIIPQKKMHCIPLNVEVGGVV